MRIIIFIFSFAFSIVSHTQIIDSTACSNYKVGKFYTVVGKDTCHITRTESRQKERCNGSDIEYELIVIWLSKKKYLLRDIHFNPSTKPVKMRKDIVMTIMDIKADHYIVHIKGGGQRKRLLTVYCNN